MEKVDVLYQHRFSEKEKKEKEIIWQVLCENYFQQYISPGDTLLDLASGYGEFSRYIKAERKLAVDLNPDSASCVAPDVTFHLGSATDLSFIKDGEVDIVFTSNFFEHLPDKKTFDVLLAEVLRILKPGGRFMAMQPNIRYAPGKYWDFYDHHLPLSHLSCAEAFLRAGFSIDRLIGRFLPYSTKSRFPKNPALIALYLRIPQIWPLFGKQFFILGSKPLKTPV